MSKKKFYRPPSPTTGVPKHVPPEEGLRRAGFIVLDNDDIHDPSHPIHRGREKMGAAVQAVVEGKPVGEPLAPEPDPASVASEAHLEEGTTPGEVREESKGAIEAALLEELPIEKFETVFVPPDEGEAIVPKGKGEKIEKKKIHSRFELLKDLLKSMGVDLKECKAAEGTNTQSMMREESYRTLVIPALNRMVLVCDEEGNRTFVVYTSEKPEHYRGLRKSQLDELRGTEVEPLTWCGSSEWVGRMHALLLDDPSKREAPARGMEDKEYFNSFRWVRQDLEAFAALLGEEYTVFGLNANTMPPLRIQTARGEWVSGEFYLNKAGVALGIADTAQEAHAKRATVARKLRELAGYRDIDKAYCEDSEAVNYDLREFAKQIPEASSPLDVTSANIHTLRITASNGEKLTGNIYLRRVRTFLGHSTAAETMAYLHKLGGYEAMNRDYFQNLENIRKDFNTILEIEGLDLKVVQDITASVSTANKEFTAANGQRVKTKTYFNRMAIALGYATGWDDMGSDHARLIQETIKRLGHIVLDAEYFSQRERVRHDLLAFCREAGVERIEELTYNKMKGKQILASNGQELSVQSYLGLAGLGFGLAEKVKETRSIYGEILSRLKACAA